MHRFKARGRSSCRSRFQADAEPAAPAGRSADLRARRAVEGRGRQKVCRRRLLALPRATALPRGRRGGLCAPPDRLAGAGARIVAPRREDTPLAAFAFSEPGGSANFAASAPAEGRMLSCSRWSAAPSVIDRPTARSRSLPSFGRPSRLRLSARSVGVRPWPSTDRCTVRSDWRCIAKAFGSETAVRVISDLMRVVGIDSYDRTLFDGD